MANDIVDETDGVLNVDVLDPRIVCEDILASSSDTIMDDDEPPITWTVTHNGPVAKGKDFVVTSWDEPDETYARKEHRHDHHRQRRASDLEAC